MNIEIERKFIVKILPIGLRGTTVHQGYLQTEKERTIRVRTVQSEKSLLGFLTIKGKGNKSGMSRYEFETEIPVTDADHLLSLCDKPLIKKTRYKYEHGGLTWEIDKFLSENEGLILAEVELESEEQSIEKPDFVGKEVTGQVKYYNMMLMKYPFTSWDK